MKNTKSTKTSNKNKIMKIKRRIQLRANRDAKVLARPFLASTGSRARLKRIIQDMFLAKDGIEIPDEAIVGSVMEKIESLKAQVDCLVTSLNSLSHRINGQDGTTHDLNERLTRLENGIRSLVN